MRDAPKDGHTLEENRHTQPIARHRVFNNHEVLTEGWYPLCPSKRLARGAAESFRIGYQRVVAYRGDDGTVRALDAFCPHMGADLANGRVIGNELQCYFHQWQFDERGTCTKLRCGEPPPKGARLAAYPVEERYGFVWVFAGPIAHHAVPTCAGLEGHEVEAMHLGRVTLYAHHHAMMAGGIDLQHFGSVHDLDATFELDVNEDAQGVADFVIEGTLPKSGFRARAGRALLGDKFGYTLRVAGGTVAAITYGREPRFRGTGARLPTFHVLWGCTPLASGVSTVDVFLLAKRGDGIVERAGALAHLKARAGALARLGATGALLAALRDDDVKAFPHMRFNPRNLVHADRSVARFIHYANKLPISRWSKEAP